MKNDGRLYVCDRCGEKDFFKRTKVESLSGGYEHVGVYELADGWTYSYGKDLCPSCSKSFDQLKESFFTKTEEYNG